MGTSTSQHSARNTNWGPVQACYIHSNIPEERVVNEIWRASENDPTPISEYLKGDMMYNCNIVLRDSNNIQEALQKFTEAVIGSKANNIAVELAKRAICKTFQYDNPKAHLGSELFSETTSYFLSRDISGYVGRNCRNKTITDLIGFKKSIMNRVAAIIGEDRNQYKSKREWNTYIENSIQKLKTTK